MASISAALGTDRKSDLEFIKHRYHINRTDGLANDKPKALLLLNGLRLDTDCFEAFSSHYEKQDPLHRPMALTFKTVIINTNESEKQNGLKAVLGRLMQVLSSSLKEFHVLDRGDHHEISPGQVAALFHSLRHTKSLQTLFLRNLNLQGHPDIGPSLEDMLLHQGQILTSLKLCECSFDNSVLTHLVQSIPLMTALSDINVRGCSMDHDMQDRLVTALIACRASNVSLQKCFQRGSVHHLTRLLFEKENLQRLDLSGNTGLLASGRGETEIKSFSSALANSSLQQLILRGCADMGSEAVVSLFHALEQNPGITELDLTQCGIVTTQWTSSLPFIQGLSILRVPFSLRSPPISAALLIALQTNTSLCMIAGDGRWRQPSAQVQRMLLRNQLMRAAQYREIETYALWPRFLVHLASNQTLTRKKNVRVVTQEMSPVYIFIRTRFVNDFSSHL